MATKSELLTGQAQIKWTMLRAHLDWLKKRQACGANAECIMTRIVEQIRELDANRPSDPRWILDPGPKKK